MKHDDPYREAREEPVACYRIRSSAGFAVALGFTALVALTSLWLGWGLARFGGQVSDWLPGVTVMVVGPLAFGAMFTSRHTYLVAGGTGQIELFADRVEISDGSGRHLIDGRSMRHEQIRHRANVWIGFIPLATVETDRHIRMQSPGRQFQLSRRLFADPDEFDAFARDVDLLGRGELGREPAPAPSPAPDADPDAEYRRRLAYELDHVDDV
ncbi:MAG: hypothetical protein AAF721_20170 [Myxococcota bacterium]